MHMHKRSQLRFMGSLLTVLFNIEKNWFYEVFQLFREQALLRFAICYVNVMHNSSKETLHSASICIPCGELHTCGVFFFAKLH